MFRERVVMPALALCRSPLYPRPLLRAPQMRMQTHGEEHFCLFRCVRAEYHSSRFPQRFSRFPPVAGLPFATGWELSQSVMSQSVLDTGVRAAYFRRIHSTS